MTHHHTRPAITPRTTCAALLLALASATAMAQVGMTRLDLGGQSVTMVYPTAQRAEKQRFGPFELEVALDAVPTAGPHRLVVMSHGAGGNALSDHAQAAAFARAGLVVAQPLHAGDNHLDSSKSGPAAWQTRPGEVSRVIDSLGAHPTWRSLLKTDRVGVHGMSAGGVTALAMAGAQWRMLNLVQHCGENLDADLGFCFFGITDPAAQAARRASYMSARGVPEAFLPAELKVVHGGRTPAGTQPDGTADVRPDRRVAAVSVAVPVAAIFSAESLARIGVPVGVVSAGRDTVVLPAFHSEHILRSCKSCISLARLAGAGHFDLLAPWPAELARNVAATQARGGANEAGFDAAERDRAFERVAAFQRQKLDAK